MANSAADSSLQDQVTEAFSVTTTRVDIVVTDTRISVQSIQDDDANPSNLVQQFRIRTTSKALISAIVAAVVATGRP